MNPIKITENLVEHVAPELRPPRWLAEVIADSSGEWSGNGLRFDTKADAEAYVHDLSMRWTLVRDTRVRVETGTEQQTDGASC